MGALWICKHISEQSLLCYIQVHRSSLDLGWIFISVGFCGIVSPRSYAFLSVGAGGCIALPHFSISPYIIHEGKFLCCHFHSIQFHPRFLVYGQRQNTVHRRQALASLLGSSHPKGSLTDRMQAAPKASTANKPKKKKKQQLTFDLPDIDDCCF